MNKEELDKLNKEKDYLLIQLDLDKFHYKRSVSNFISKILVYITLFIGLIPLLIAFINSISFFVTINLLILFLFILMITSALTMLFYKIIQISKDYSGQITSYKNDIKARNNMIKELYNKLGVDTKGFDEEFKKNGGYHLD